MYCTYSSSFFLLFSSSICHYFHNSSISFLPFDEQTTLFLLLHKQRRKVNILNSTLSILGNNPKFKFDSKVKKFSGNLCKRNSKLDPSLALILSPSLLPFPFPFSLSLSLLRSLSLFKLLISFSFSFLIPAKPSLHAKARGV